jgi:hypothetical protein
LIERDGYRAGRGKREMWGGSNLGLLKTALGRGNSLSENAAIQRAGLDKTWRWNWARGGSECLACSSQGSQGITHPIWKCNNPQMLAYRENWKKRIRKVLDNIPRDDRVPVEELWRCMEYGEGGEYACCGVFQPRFYNALVRADDVLTHKKRKQLVRFIREVGYGARGLLKLHSEIIKPERVKAFRQPLIKEYMNKPSGKMGKGQGKSPRSPGEDDGLLRIKRAKRVHKISRYTNPESEESEDEEMVIRNPPSPEVIFSRFVRIRGGGNGDPMYWEWKAG